jgi:hypothetical protein
MTPATKKWIKQASLKELMDKAREEPPDSEWFAGEQGEYFFTMLREAVRKMCDQDQVFLASSEEDAPV